MKKSSRRDDFARLLNDPVITLKTRFERLFGIKRPPSAEKVINSDSLVLQSERFIFMINQLSGTVTVIYGDWRSDLRRNNSI